MALLPTFLLILALSGMTMAGCTWAFHAPFSAPYRIREAAERKLKGPKVAARMILNSLFSALLLAAIVFGATSFLVHDRATSWWRAVGDAAAILLIYDFSYYLLHRYPFHEWRVLKKVHAVHHMAKNPIAIDSLFLHPVENLLGNLLFLGCVALWGPVSLGAFAIAFFFYTQLNVWVHAGLALPWFPLTITGYLARKHDAHHINMRGGNYASITPLPDLLFGTRE